VRVGPSWIVAVVPEPVVGGVVKTAVEVVEVGTTFVGELEVVEMAVVVPPLPEVVVVVLETAKCSSRSWPHSSTPITVYTPGGKVMKTPGLGVLMPPVQ
jgi:hypothetical protein